MQNEIHKINRQKKLNQKQINETRENERKRSFSQWKNTHKHVQTNNYTENQNDNMLDLMEFNVHLLKYLQEKHLWVQ
jgi:hypothetical protein